MKGAGICLLALALLLGTVLRSCEAQKPGKCPRVNVVCALLNIPVKCKSDSRCPGRQKCCRRFCSVECTNPVDPNAPPPPIWV
ncbi:hypothetical protein NDU88_011662 [Pleurodeles waltl]|uniref:WAP domain-containing protein n=1 Tax=Pleurodeles waltl TaxID=8319 RepID=A0AAV7S4V9_PLEWA|nr:hypothetical protein NDU88_011662 [Pleurodeles waltl]